MKSGEIIMKNLVIVESPAKSKTIEKYLGKDYVVASSIGHIRDLATTGVGGFGVDIEDNFSPTYKSAKGKAPVIRELKKLVKAADKVYLATDPDREGEAISWHLYDALELKDKEYERIVFHEISKKAVIQAIENGRELDMDLVHSQESRRILDRIIGFSLSKLLQRKIGSKSAGRVQSVALKLVVEKEKEIIAFIPVEFWEVFLDFQKDGETLRAKLEKYNDEKIEFNNKAEVDKVLNSLANDYVVSDIITKERSRKSRPPYITSTLQQDSVNKLRFPSRKTMMIAQKLYEGIELEDERVGLITYMRTDSIRLSNEFISEAKSFITNEYGSKYYKGYEVIPSKSKTVQDAHEAIRPVNLNYTPAKIKKFLTADEYKLYELIYSRTLASFMSNAIFEDKKLLIDNNDYTFELNGSKLIFDGFLKVFADEEVDRSLPDFIIGSKLDNPEIVPEQKFTKPPARYTEASLIKKLEELGIGRPSTYAITIDTLKARFYVKMERNTFVPTEQGILTSDELDKFFSNIINVAYTANMEEVLDKISTGDIVWYNELAKFYELFMPLLDYAEEHMEKIYPIYVDEECPKCGSKLVYRNGRYGRFLACSAFPKCRYIKTNEEEVVKTDIVCPVCKKGMIIEKTAKRGRNSGKKFYACDRYPECKTTFSSLEEVKEKAK